MILHLGERVYWGAPEVIYLEGTIVKLDEATQTVVVHIDRATPYSSHLIGSDVPFSADGLTPLRGESPPGTTTEHNAQRQPTRQMTDEEKIYSAAAAAVYQRFGSSLAPAQKQTLIEQVVQVLNSDPDMRARIIASMNEILNREL